MTATIITTTKTGLKVIRGKAGRELLRHAEVAHTPAARAKVETRIEELVGAVGWKEFGGTGRVAHSAIGATGDALHLAGEPIVNEGDGLIELQRALALRRGDTFTPSSPREAAAHYFGLPADGMSEWDTRTGANRKLLEKVAKLSQVLVYGGSNSGEATLVYVDWGIGQHPADFEETVLSLQKGLKANIPYLAGQYGHGAGLTLNFTNAGQILIGRRHPDLRDAHQDDLVGLTIVRKFRPSEVGSVFPAYRYLVDAETGMPVAFEASALRDPRWHGLRRICIDFELGPPADQIGDRPTGGLYYHLDNLLPCPPLPWTLRDERAATVQSRLMRGVASRLTARAKGWAQMSGKNPIKVTGPIHTNVDVTASASDGHDYGEVGVSVWVVEQENTPRGNELFGPARAAETWSITGQVHEARGRDHFAQEPIKLDALKKHLKVNIECDGLTDDAKAEIFTTGRQGTAERRAQRTLADAIDQVLANNVELRELDQKIKEKALRRATEGVDAELQRALTEFQHLFEQEIEVSVASDGDKKQKGKKGKAPKIKPLEPIKPVYAEPTFLRFRKVFRDKLKLRPGSTSSILLEADAVDNYFPEKENVQFSTTPDLGATVRVFARERLAHGRMRIHLVTAKDATPGHAVLAATCLPSSSSGPLSDTIDLEIVSAAAGKGKGRKRKEKRKVAPPHRVLWKEDTTGNSWADEGMSDWTKETVGEFKTGVAYVNGDFKPFRQLLDQVKVDQRQSIIRLYVPPVVMALVGLDKRKSDPPKGDDDNPVDIHPVYERDFLRSVALGSIFTIRRLKKLGLGIGGLGEET